MVEIKSAKETTAEGELEVALQSESDMDQPAELPILPDSMLAPLEDDTFLDSSQHQKRIRKPSLKVQEAQMNDLPSSAQDNAEYEEQESTVVFSNSDEVRAEQHQGENQEVPNNDVSNKARVKKRKKGERRRVTKGKQMETQGDKDKEIESDMKFVLVMGKDGQTNIETMASIGDPKYHRSKKPQQMKDESEAAISKKTPCPFCNKRFRSNWGLLPHVYQCHPDVDEDSDLAKEARDQEEVANVLGLLNKMKEVEGDVCPNCNKKFKLKREGQIHYALQSCVKRTQYSKMSESLPKDPVTGLYKCRQCDFTSQIGKRVLNHEERNHMERTVPCGRCGKLFASERMVEEHIRQSHIYSKKMVVCDICGTSVSAPYLGKHKLVMHDPTYVKPRKSKSLYLQCPKCLYRAPKLCLLKKHIKRKHEEKQLQCPECKTKFAMEADLQAHIKNIHDQADNPLNHMVKCNQCDKEMKQRNLDLHIRQVHQKMGKHVCDIFYKTLSSKHSLKVHVMFAHTRPEDRTYKYTCQHCGAGFINKTVYNGHLNTHTGNRPYKCEVCDKAFKQITTYHSHIQIHKAVKYECQVCEQQFSSKSSLATHTKQHPCWQCVCEQRFWHTEAVVAHQATCPSTQLQKGSIEAIETVKSEADGAAASYIMIQPQEAVGEETGEETFVMVQGSEVVGEGEGQAMTMSQIIDSLQKGETPAGGLVQLVQLADNEGESKLQDPTQEELVVQLDPGQQHMTAMQAVAEGACDGQIMVHHHQEAVAENLHTEAQVIATGDLKQEAEWEGQIRVGEGAEEDAGAFLCGHCQQEFTSMQEVEEHMMTQHMEETEMGQYVVLGSAEDT